MLPERSPYVVLGAGIHGLSTAWHLAIELERAGTGTGADVLVLDKAEVGAGASGVACGVIRNNYFQPAMRELMAHSVGVWESDPEAFAYHPVGYIQVAPDVMRDDVVQIYNEQRAIGYESELVEGEDACAAYMRGIFEDWQAPQASVVLHEKRGGYANNMASLHALEKKCQDHGVQVVTGVEVTGFERADGRVRSVVTSGGTVACDHVTVAVGPWVRDIWAMLDLPETIDVTGPNGEVSAGHPMWTYWALQEGTIDVDPDSFKTNAGEFPPVVHVDLDVPLHDEKGLITNEFWGIYYKPDFNFGGVQGGAAPLRVKAPAAEVAVDPYGTKSPDFVVGEDFKRLWTAALSLCHDRFANARQLYKDVPSGGIGAFTPDSFPVFDTFSDNVYVIADSNHGYKMIGVGELVAKEIVGTPQDLLKPFRFSRYATGDLHPTSHSPFPWS